jgi:hypothetical protein
MRELVISKIILDLEYKPSVISTWFEGGDAAKRVMQDFEIDIEDIEDHECFKVEMSEKQKNIRYFHLKKDLFLFKYSKQLENALRESTDDFLLKFYDLTMNERR